MRSSDSTLEGESWIGTRRQRKRLDGLPRLWLEGFFPKRLFLTRIAGPTRESSRNYLTQARISHQAEGLKLRRPVRTGVKFPLRSQFLRWARKMRTSSRCFCGISQIPSDQKRRFARAASWYDCYSIPRQKQSTESTAPVGALFAILLAFSC